MAAEHARTPGRRLTIREAITQLEALASRAPNGLGTGLEAGLFERDRYGDAVLEVYGAVAFDLCTGTWPHPDRPDCRLTTAMIFADLVDAAEADQRAYSNHPRVGHLAPEPPTPGPSAPPGTRPPGGDALIGQMVAAADALTDAAAHLHTAAAALDAAGAAATRRQAAEGLAVQAQAEADTLAGVIAAWKAGAVR